MALQLISLQRSKQPLKNEYGSGSVFDDRLRAISASLYNQVRQTPELISMLDTVVVDHFGSPVDFFDANGKPLGPTKLNKIQRFWEDHDVQGAAFYGQALDFFIDGSSFGWHVSANNILTAKQKESLVKLKALSSDIGNFAVERSNMPRKLSYLAASTVTIKHDDTGILYYVQEASGKRVKWDVDQVVHIKLMDFNGEVRGFTPMKALVKEIVLMYLLKENITAALQNGGSMDHIISLKGANGASKARFKRLQTALESFSHLKKSHGNMPIDAEVQVHAMGAQLKDMEYRELAMFIISEFSLSLGLPTSRVPFLMTGSGGSSNKGELSGNAEDAYQNKINARRKKWENGWNKVFRKAGFTFKFRRDNLQDDVRETQASTQRAAYVIQVQESLSKIQKQLTLSAQLALLSGKKMDIREDDVEDAEIEQVDVLSPIAGPGGRMQPSNMDAESKVTRDRSQSKEKTAFNNGVSA